MDEQNIKIMDDRSYQSYLRFLNSENAYIALGKILSCIHSRCPIQDVKDDIAMILEESGVDLSLCYD